MELERIAECAVRKLEKRVANAMETRKELAEPYKAEHGREFPAPTFIYMDEIVETYFLAEALARFIPEDRFAAAREGFKELVEYELGRLEERAETYADERKDRPGGKEHFRKCVVDGEEARCLREIRDYLA